MSYKRIKTIKRVLFLLVLFLLYCFKEERKINKSKWQGKKKRKREMASWQDWQGKRKEFKILKKYINIFGLSKSPCHRHPVIKEFILS